MPKNTELANAMEAFQTALNQARLYEAEARKAADMVDMLEGSTSKEAFEKARDRALVAMENWRKSAELAQRVMFEISSRFMDDQ